MTSPNHGYPKTPKGKTAQSNTQYFCTQLLSFILLTTTWIVQAGEVFGTFTIDGVLATTGTVTLYDRHFNAVDSVSTNATGQYRILYQDPGLYYLNGVQGAASTDFNELQLSTGEHNLDLNLLVSNKTITIDGQVTTEAGLPISFAALQFGDKQGNNRVYSDKYGYYQLSLAVPSFARQLELDVWLGDGLSQLSQNNETLTALSTKQYFQIELKAGQLALTYNVKMPAFAKQTIKLTDFDNKPLEHVVTTIFHNDNGQLLRLDRVDSNSLGEVNFYYPVINDDSQTELTVRTLPPNTFTFDYQVEWLDDELNNNPNNNPNDNLLIEFDKRHHTTNGTGTTIVGSVDVIGDNDETDNTEITEITEITVSVLDANFNLVEQLTTNVAGSYSVTLDHWGDYYLRAETQRGKSPWRKVTARQAQVEHSIVLDNQQTIVDVNGTLQSQNGKILGGVTLDFSTADLPESLYRMAADTNPSVTTSQYGRYIISLVGQAAEVTTNYSVSIVEPAKNIYVDADAQASEQASYLLAPISNLSLNTLSADNADIILPNIFALHLSTFSPLNEPHALDVDIYQLVAGQQQFLLRLTSKNGHGVVNLPGDNPDGTAAIYRIRPQAPELRNEVWLPPLLADLSLSADQALNITMANQPVVNVSGQVTDANGLVLTEMDIGFFTTELERRDYTRAYDGYLPHDTTTVDGEYKVNLRVNEGQTSYTAANQIRINGIKDQWAKAWSGEQWLKVWLGQLAFEQTVTLAANNNPQRKPIQVPTAYYPVQLTVKNTGGDALSNVPVTLYYKDNEGESQPIEKFKSDDNGQVELYLPGEQARADGAVSYQFVITPDSTAGSVLTGQTIDFNVTNQSVPLSAQVTLEDKRFVTISGTITDSNHLVLQGLNLGVRTVEADLFDDRWHQTVSTDFDGHYSVILRASPGGETDYGVRNISQTINNDYNWQGTAYYHEWAKVSDAQGRHDAWLRGVKIKGEIELPAGQNEVVAHQQLSVGLKKASLTVQDNRGGVQVGTSVVFSFKGQDGRWRTQKTLTTDETGTVSLYLLALTDAVESYRWEIIPVSDNNVNRSGQIIDFTIAQTDENYSATGQVTITDKRYITIKGVAKDANNLLLQDLTLGIRTIQANAFDNSWYQSVSTDTDGAFSVTLRVSPDTQTLYGVRNINQSISSDFYWNGTTYYDEWAKVSDGQGRFDAWLRGVRFNHELSIYADEQEVTAIQQLPVGLKKASLTVLGEQDVVQVGTSVEFAFKGLDGLWKVEKTLTTDASGRVSLYLLALTDEREAYRWAIKPDNDNDQIRTGETIEFNIVESDRFYASTGRVTAAQKRYINISGIVKDRNQLLVQGLTLGVRTKETDLFDERWYQSVLTDTNAAYHAELRASSDAETHYEIRNIHHQIQQDYYWNSADFYDEWGSVDDGTGFYHAWLRGVKLNADVVVPTNNHQLTKHLQIPVALKKASLTVYSNKGDRQVGTEVVFSFKGLDDRWQVQQTLTTDASGNVSIYLLPLIDSRESYRWNINPTSNNDQILTGNVIDFTIDEADADHISTGIVTITDKRYINITGTVKDRNNLLIQDLALGIRTTQADLFDSHWYINVSTDVDGIFNARLRAFHHADTQYGVRNIEQSVHSDYYWNGLTNYDEWASVDDGVGRYHAWLRGVKLDANVVVSTNEQAITAALQLPASFKKASLTVRNQQDEVQAGTVVEFSFKGLDGQWQVKQTLTTDVSGVVSIYLLALTDERESYRWQIKPVNDNDEVRTGETIDFTIGEADSAYSATGKVTIADKRYVTIKGVITDSNNLLLQDFNLGARTMQTNLFDDSWYQSISTGINGAFSVTLRALPDVQTHYGLRNISQSVKSDYNWNSTAYYDEWASVSDDNGQYHAWLRGVKLNGEIFVSADKSEIVANQQLSVGLKKASLTVRSNKDERQVGATVEFSFKGAGGQWKKQKTLTTDNTGTVSIYLLALTDARESYRWQIKPVSDENEIRTGQTIDFTIAQTDNDYRGIGEVTVADKRYVSIKGTVSDSNQLLLEALSLGIRTTQADLFDDRWYQSVVTEANGSYQMELRAMPNDQTHYGVRNNNRTIQNDYNWNNPAYHDQWAFVNDDTGRHHAWLRTAKLDAAFTVAANQNTVTKNLQIAVALKKASLTIRSDSGDIQAGTTVTFHFKGLDGIWTLQKSLTTDATGKVSIYLPDLLDDRERYRWVITPVSDSEALRTGQTIDFTLAEQDSNYEEEGKVTIVDKRYINLHGSVTDTNGLLLQDLTLGIRTTKINLFDDNWYQYNNTDANGHYSVQLRASHSDEVTNYGVRNKNRGVETDWGWDWDSPSYYDRWVSVSDDIGRYEAWLRDVKLDASIEVPPGAAKLIPSASFDLNLVAPIELFKFTTQAKDENGYPLTGVRVDYAFHKGFTQITPLKNTTIGSSGEYALYLPDLKDEREFYQVTVTDNGFYGFEQSQIATYQLAQDKTLFNVITFTDDQAPKFVSDPYISYRSDISALIVWFTDEPAKSSVAVNGQTFASNALTKRHSVQVTGLTPGEGYTATVKSVDASGNESLLNPLSFTTLLEVDLFEPVFTLAPVLSQVGADVAVVDFSADEPVTAVVRVKDGDVLVSEVIADELSASHQITLTGLYPLSAYQVEITITDANQNGPVSTAPLSLVTKENTDHIAPRFVTQPVVRNITSTSATIYWTSDEPAVSAISYNLKGGGNHIPLRSDDFNRQHVQTLTGLEPDQQYEFTISLSDVFENGPRLSRQYSFYTRDQLDTDPPVLLSEVATIQLGDSSATLVWSTDEAASGVVLFGETANALTEAVVAPTPDISQHLALDQLKADTTYFYQLITKDTVGNELATPVASFTTKSVGSAAPLAYIGLPTLLQVTGETLTVGLRTNKAAHGEVLCYDNNGEVHDSRSVLENKHQQLIITSLSPGHYYQCQVNSWTGAGDRIGSTLLGDTFGTSIIRSLDHRDDQYPMLTAGPEVTYQSGSVAVIEWQTHELSQTALSIRESNLARYKATSTAGYRTHHSQIITSLKPDTAYHYRMILQDLAGNSFEAGDYSFTSAVDADESAPEFVASPMITSIRGGEVGITLTASEPVTASVVYNVDGQEGTIRQIADDNDYRLSHHMVLDLGLDNDYELNVQIRDLAGHHVTAAEPLILSLKSDSDGDGLTDAFESFYGIDNTSMSADGDEDGDGVTNLEEQNRGLDPTNSDTDGDGVNDSDDVFPTNPGEVSDTDGDGLGDNIDNQDDLLGQVFVFDEMVPNLVSDWYFQNVVGTAVNRQGLVSILEYHGANDLRLKLFNASDNGRMVNSKPLGGYVGGWQHVVGIEYLDHRWHIVAMHQIDGVNRWYWHQLTEYGHYLKSHRVELDGLSPEAEAVRDMQVTIDGLSVLTLTDNRVELRLFDDKGKLEERFNLPEVDVTTRLRFGQNSAGTLYVVAADSGDCGTLWLYDKQGDPDSRLIVSDYQQNRCALLQDIQVLENNHILIDAQTELYEVDRRGGLVNLTITNQTGHTTRHLASSKGRRYLVTDGVMLQYDSQLKQLANYSAFSARNGYFADDNFAVYANPYAQDSNEVWTIERNTGRAQLFDFNTQAEQRFKRSFSLKDTANRLINTQDMVVAKWSGMSEANLMVLENTDTQVLLHRFTQLGGWGGQVVLPGGFGIAVHYQNDYLFILARDTLAQNPSSQYHIWRFNLTTNTVDATWSLLEISAKALDISGDGNELYLLQHSPGNENQLAVARLNGNGELINQQVLTRLDINSAISDKARLSVGPNRLLVSYGPQIHLHQLDSTFSFVQVFDQLGYGPAQNALGSNTTAEFTPQGKLVWADTAQGRLQALKPTLVDINAKAIIVSGGGEYLGNNLWVGTLLNANMAYRTLRRQGFAKDRIFYLSDKTVDFDGNGVDDELFALASKANLQAAITWGNDADSLTLYMVDHGNIDKFRIQPDEIISADEVSDYLESYTGNLSVIYDACKSGSFVDELQGDNRTIITSSDATRDALFLQSGAISFSGLFWQYIDNGQDMYTAYTQSEAFFDRNRFTQDPQLSINGVDDESQLIGRYIGQGYKHVGADISIDSVQNSIVDNEIVINARLSGDLAAVQRVWAVVLPDGGAIDDDITSPVVDVPSVDLSLAEDGSYRGQISTSVLQGSQYISILAQDNQGNKQGPYLTYVSAEANAERRAILVAAYQNASQLARVNLQIENAYSALSKQGYSDDNIKVLTKDFIKADEDSDIDALEVSINGWATETQGDLFVYIAGDMDAAQIRLQGNAIDSSTLVSWLDGAMVSRGGTLSVLLDGHASAGFASAMTGFAEPPIIMAANAATEFAPWLLNDYFSFSQVFFANIGQGALTWDAYVNAKSTFRSWQLQQTPYLDTDDDGKSVHKKDGRILHDMNHMIGRGMLLAGDEPLIGSVQSGLASDNSITFEASHITTTSQLAEVYAYIAHPRTEGAPAVVAKVELTDDGQGRYSGIYHHADEVGEYLVQYFARNNEGYISLLTDDVQTRQTIEEGDMNTDDGFTLDIDGNGEIKPLTDGMLLIRYLFGFRDEVLIDGVVSADAARQTAVDIGALIQSGIDDLSLDIDGDGEVRALTDGLLCLRYLFGFRGGVLIDQVVSGDATRVSVDEIEVYLGLLGI